MSIIMQEVSDGGIMVSLLLEFIPNGFIYNWIGL